VTVNFVDPDDGVGTVTVTGLIQTDVCAEPGDSGGSLLAADQAQGTVSGGSGDCTAGGQTFFQPINEVLQTLDLTLLTTS
jgi:streptogrisin C